MSRLKGFTTVFAITPKP